MIRTPRYLAFAIVTPLLAFGWLLLAFLGPNGPPSAVSYLIVGNLFGILFGQTTLAAAWTALGPLPLNWRLPLSLAWVVSLPIGLAVNMSLHSGGGDKAVVVIMTLCVLAQWAIVQIPLWGLALAYRLRLRHVSDLAGSTQSDRQFGIRQLMILTAIVAVILGLARAAIAGLRSYFDEPVGGDWLIFVFLAIAAVLMTLPLLLSALLPRHALAATAAVLVLTAILTAWELPLMARLVPAGAGGATTWIFVCINAFQAGWVLAVIGLVRLGGYRLSSGIQQL